MKDSASYTPSGMDSVFLRATASLESMICWMDALTASAP